MEKKEIKPEEKEEKKESKEDVKTEKKVVETQKKEIGKKETEKEKVEDKKDSKEVEKTEEKPVEKKETEVKKTSAFVNISSIPISTKHSIAICKFIKGKKIEGAIDDLEKVVLLKKAVPMKGEIPHRKGMMSGRYPKKAAGHFIKLLKGLSANANVNGLEAPVISEAIANLASRPYSKFGRVRRKRTHIKITATTKQTPLPTSLKTNQNKGENIKEEK